MIEFSAPTRNLLLQRKHNGVNIKVQPACFAMTKLATIQEYVDFSLHT